MELNLPTDRYDNSRHVDVVCKYPILSSARVPSHLILHLKLSKNEILSRRLQRNITRLVYLIIGTGFLTGMVLHLYKGSLSLRGN